MVRSFASGWTPRILLFIDAKCVLGKRDVLCLAKRTVDAYTNVGLSSTPLEGVGMDPQIAAGKCRKNDNNER